MCTPFASDHPGWICCRCIARNNHTQPTCKKCAHPRDHYGIPLNDSERDLTIAYDEMFNGRVSLEEWIEIFVPCFALSAAGRGVSIQEEFTSRLDDIKDELEFRDYPADALERIRIAMDVFKPSWKA
jgi:hypothetical protein